MYIMGEIIEWAIKDQLDSEGGYFIIHSLC